MKLLIILLCQLLVLTVNASEVCDRQVRDYIIRGDVNSTAVGARLWRLTQLKKDSEQNKACAKEIFDRALVESDQYWNHIDAKYKCAALSEGARDPSLCSDAMNDNVLSNKTYLAFVKMGQQTKKECTARDSSANLVIGKAARDSLHDTAEALQKMAKPINKCDNVPAQDRILVSVGKTPEAQLAFDLSKGLESCIAGLLTGFFKEGIFKSLKSIWSSLTDPWSSLGSLQELAKAFIKNPSGTVSAIAKNIANSLYDKFLSKYENFDCYHSAKKSQIMCSSIGQGAAAVVEQLIGAQALKTGSKILKSFKKAGTSTALVEKEAAANLRTIIQEEPKLLGNNAKTAEPAKLLENAKVERSAFKNPANKAEVDKIQNLKDLGSEQAVRDALGVPDGEPIRNRIKALTQKYHSDKVNTKGLSEAEATALRQEADQMVQKLNLLRRKYK